MGPGSRPMIRAARMGSISTLSGAILYFSPYILCRITDGCYQIRAASHWFGDEDIRSLILRQPLSRLYQRTELAANTRQNLLHSKSGTYQRCIHETRTLVIGDQPGLYTTFLQPLCQAESWQWFFPHRENHLSSRIVQSSYFTPFSVCSRIRSIVSFSNSM